MTARTNKSAVTPDPASIAGVSMTSERSKELSDFADDVATNARPRPNIKFIGRPTYDAGKRKILNDPSPIDRFSEGGVITKLPPADWQKRYRLFYHESAGKIAALFPHLYKLVIQK